MALNGPALRGALCERLGAGLSVVAKLALQRGMPSFAGGPFGRMGPIRSFDEFAVSANRPLEMPGGLFGGEDGQGVGVHCDVIAHGRTMA